MAFGNTIQGQYPWGWPELSGRKPAQPGLGEGQLRPGEVLEAKTPQEALTHIDVLYKSGRMGDLAGLLRRSEVFREAWRLMQQSSLSDLGPARSGKGSGYAGEPQDSGDFPVPQARSPAPAPQPPPAPAGGEISALVASAPDSGAARRARPAAAPGSWPAAALEAYHRQARAGAQPQEGVQRLSIRV